MTDYKPPGGCKFCGEQIKMVKEGGEKWHPVNLDGSAHICKRNDKAPVAGSAPTLEEHIRAIVREEIARARA